MCAPQTLRTLSITKMNVSEHSLLTMDSFLDLSDHSVLSVEYGCNDMEDLDDDTEFCTELDDEYDDYSEFSYDSASSDGANSQEELLKPEYHHMHQPAAVIQSRTNRKKGTVIPQRPPFAVTAIYLFTQFNVSLYLSNSIHLAPHQWFLMNCAVASFLYAAKRYRKVMLKMHVKSFISVSLAEIVTAMTLVLLILQMRSAALVVLVGGLLYMALATGIVSVYLLTVAASHSDDDGPFVPQQKRQSFSIPTQIIL